LADGTIEITSLLYALKEAAQSTLAGRPSVATLPTQTNEQSRHVKVMKQVKNASGDLKT
jgi:hypothetical protein